MKTAKNALLAAAIMGLVMAGCEELDPELTGTVTITGTAEVGQTLTANTNNLDGTGDISYRWKRGNTTIGTNINTYVVQSADVGSAITVTVTREGYSGSKTSEPTAVVTDPSLPELTGTVTITGTAEVGQTLTANTGSLGGSGTISYQWKRGTANIDANSSTYVVQYADAGSTITVTVTRSGNSGSVTSAPTAAVTGGPPANDMRQPYYYPGTGITYNGFMGTEGSRTATGGVTVTYPSETTFNADGFFTLEGTVNNSAVYNYALVRVRKTSDTSLETNYYVRDNFKQRIWLRFGPGDYTATVYGLNSITISPGLGAEGDITGWGGNSSLSFNVTNIRNEGGSVDGSIPDKRFIYPSYVVQSDDLKITQLAAELTDGLTDNTAKIKAIHDYIVANTVYDRISSDVAGMRKKQDALTVLGTRYHYDTRYTNGHFLAVCEGYANTAAALLRAAGLEVKYVSSSAMGHGWNHVYVNDSWKLLDVTWDDPLPANAGADNVIDMGPSYVSVKYFLLDNLTGVDGDHYGDVPKNDRSVIGGSTIPRQKGVPDGWY